MKQAVIAEFLGSAFLLAIIIGSGIMGENLAQGNTALALLANSLATGAGLFVLIQCLGPVSGANLNPIVTFLEYLWGRVSRRTLFAYWIAQFAGAIIGVFMTHAMFGQKIIQSSEKMRDGPNLWISELVATFGLICVIFLADKKKADSVPISVALYITAAYWFTSSTSFANPAVTLARSLTDTFCGIAPSGIMPFVFAQIFGAMIAFFALKNMKLEN